MGLDGDVIAVGQFSEELLPHLRLPASFYRSMDENSVFAEVLFSEVGRRGSSTTRRMAEAFGVGVWDFDSHAFSVTTVNFEALEEFVDAAEIQRFKEFAQRDFQFYFRPNG